APDVLPQDLPYAHPGEWLPARVQEYDALGIAPGEARPHLAKVDVQGSQRRTAHGHDPLPGALAEHDGKAVLEQDVADLDRRELLATDAGLVRNPGPGLALAVARFRGLGAIQQRLGLIPHNRTRQPPTGALQLHPLGRIPDLERFAHERA